MAKMRIYEVVRDSDGQVFKVRAPENADDAEIMKRLQNMQRVEEQLQPRDPTEGMSTMQKVLAGAGKGFYDIGRGVGQILGMVPQEDIDEAARLDRPLMKAGAGVTGNVLANMAAFLPTAAIPGVNTVLGSAALGGAAGAIQPVETGDSRLRNTTQGAMLGGAVTAATRAAPTIAKALIDPFRQGGQERIVGSTINRFATGGTPYTPRTPTWDATLAQATQDPGLAILERGAASASPDVAAALSRRAIDQNMAAMGAIERVAGDPGKYAAAQALRRATGRLYDDALATGIDQQMAQALQPQIQSLMARPSIKAAIKRAEGLIDEQDIARAQSGSVEGLQAVKMALDDMIEKAGRADSGIGKHTQRALTQTRSDLVDVLQQIVPKLRHADAVYARVSRPINQMEVGRELRDKMVPALMDGSTDMMGRIRAEQYAQALRSLDERIPSITGYSGATIENVMTPSQMKLLTGVRDDLANRAVMQEAARGTGSNTAQNLATQNIMSQVLGPLGMPQTWAQALASSVLGRTMASPLGLIYNRAAERALQERLAQALLDPKYAASLRSVANRPALPTGLRMPIDYATTAAVPGVVSTAQTK